MSLDYIHFEKDFYPFWSFLELDENCTLQEVQNKVNTLTEKEKQNPYIRFAWKVLSDSFYHYTFKKYRSIDTVYDAGFFIDQYEDNNDISFDVSFMTTPFQKLLAQIKTQPVTDQPYMVLLTTGGFSPIHKRHKEMMDMAKLEVEKQGYSVIGGYFSPSHDNYVSQKHNGQAALHVEKRMQLIEQLVAESDWLYADRWEAYYNQQSINFTDVIRRLEAYLNHHIPTQHGIRVCYVFGADNVGFMRTFVHDGYALCVNRKGYDETFYSYQKEFAHSSRLFFLEESEVESISSSSVRKGSHQFLDVKVQPLYAQFLKQEQTTSSNDVYAIRNDLEQALHLSHIQATTSDIQLAIDELKGNLLDAFAQNLTLKQIDLSHQYEEAHAFIQEKEKSIRTLSLDVYIRGNENFDISRLFELGGGQLAPQCLIHRPGSLPLEQQLTSIQPGKYLLVEDDIASGNTMRKLFELLPNTVTIDDMYILSHLDTENQNQEFFDIIDMRDFIFGLKHSGLVVSLPNEQIVRVPYVFPYVTPSSRANIPPGKELEFSTAVWEMNHRFYERVQPDIRLENLDTSFIELMTYVGFKSSDKMLDIINWHLTKLKRVVTTNDSHYTH